MVWLWCWIIISNLTHTEGIINNLGALVGQPIQVYGTLTLVLTALIIKKMLTNILKVFVKESNLIIMFCKLCS